jgi:hypothetical protein
MIGKLFIFVFLHSIFKWHVNTSFQHVLTSTIERKIALAKNACSILPITIKSHNLHASNIKGAMGEIASYHERD